MTYYIATRESFLPQLLESSRIARDLERSGWTVERVAPVAGMDDVSDQDLREAIACRLRLFINREIPELGPQRRVAALADALGLEVAAEAQVVGERAAQQDSEAAMAERNLTRGELDDIAEALRLPKDAPGRHGAVLERVRELARGTDQLTLGS